MKNAFKIFLISFIVIQSFLVALIVITRYNTYAKPENLIPSIIFIPTPTLIPKLTLQTPPISKILQNNYHVFQSFNNCGPAALSMALSYYGISQTQEKLGQDLRPYQIPGGDNDDKSVTLSELAKKSREYGFIPYHRPNGDLKMIKLFITYDMPVIARTYLLKNEDIGHYRIIKGYDETTGEIIQDDSLQGKNLKYAFQKFNNIWKKFNYEFLVLVPKDKEEIAKAILGENANEKTAWEKAATTSQEELAKNPEDIYAGFNLSVAYYNIGNFKESISEFEKVESRLPFRALWYQIEPILAYYKIGNFEKVFSITDRVLNYHNKAFSELYILRGNIYRNQGNLELARQEFEKAVFYNTNLEEAKEALSSL